MRRCVRQAEWDCAMYVCFKSCSRGVVVCVLCLTVCMCVTRVAHVVGWSGVCGG